MSRLFFNSSLISFAIFLVTPLLAISMLPACGDQQPLSPKVVVVDGDNGTDAQQAPMIPAGARFFSQSADADNTELIDQFATGSRIVISRIDYTIVDPDDITTIEFRFIEQDGVTTVDAYKLPISAPSSGTMILTYPIDQGGTGGGLGYEFGAGGGKVMRFRMDTVNHSLSHATIFGYTYNPGT